MRKNKGVKGAAKIRKIKQSYHRNCSPVVPLNLTEGTALCCILHRLMLFPRRCLPEINYTAPELHLCWRWKAACHPAPLAGLNLLWILHISTPLLGISTSFASPAATRLMPRSRFYRPVPRAGLNHTRGAASKQRAPGSPATRCAVLNCLIAPALSLNRSDIYSLA